MLQKIENWFFKFRLPVLAVFVLITIVMAYFAVQIRMDAGFAKQLPNSHSFVKTYYEYQDDGSCKNVKGLGNGSCSDPARFSAQKYKGDNGRLAKCLCEETYSVQRCSQILEI